DARALALRALARTAPANSPQSSRRCLFWPAMALSRLASVAEQPVWTETSIFAAAAQARKHAVFISVVFERLTTLPTRPTVPTGVAWLVNSLRCLLTDHC